VVPFTIDERRLPDKIMEQTPWKGDVAGIEKKIETLKSETGTLWSRTFLTQLKASFETIMVRLELEREAFALFDRALQDRSITAWVLHHDSTAIVALKYLKMKKIAVPEEMSVVSFDNTSDSICNELTSYDFNIQSLAYQTLNYILNKRSVQAERGEREIEIAGMLITRNSTGKRVQKGDDRQA
jgi:DNA-binding LacI/PurR family transcriptional regulator